MEYGQSRIFKIESGTQTIGNERKRATRTISATKLEPKYLHVIGNGTSDTERSNAYTLDWSGNAEYAGDVVVNACGGDNPISLVELNSTINQINENKVNKENDSLTTNDKTVIGAINEISSSLTELNNNKVDKEDLISSNILHNEVALSELLQLYMLDIDYQSTLAFNTSEIVISREETTAVLGQAMLGKMVLA